MKRLRCALFACALTSAMGVLAGPAITATGPYQPFISTSYWRTPSSAPADAKSGANHRETHADAGAHVCELQFHFVLPSVAQW